MQSTFDPKKNEHFLEILKEIDPKKKRRIKPNFFEVHHGWGKRVPVERLEQHFQSESYRQLENALLTRYVAGDELRAMEILNRLSDENPGSQMTSMVARERSELKLKNGI